MIGQPWLRCSATVAFRRPQFSPLLQRIVFDTDEIRGIIFCCRMRAATLLIRDFFGARPAHQAWMAVISFDTTRLV